MITVEEAARLIEAIRTSGRLRDTDHLILARSWLILLERRADFDPDPVEALVQVIAALAVADANKDRMTA